MKARILLVDDSDELLSAYLAFLQATTPHEIRAASSGAEALRILGDWRPDIVVTDLIMPDMDGLELITRIRSELAPPLPVLVAMSGFPDLEQEALRRGAQVFEAKPIDTDDLLALVESLLGHRAPPEEIRAHTEARRSALSEQARVAVATTLARRPHYPEVARLGMQLLSRYFDGAGSAILLLGDEQLNVFASSGWPVGPQPEGVLGYTLDVVVSGSTLTVPDLTVMPRGAARSSDVAWRSFAAVPLRAADGLAIGALALADRRYCPFDVHDLSLLEHVASRLGAVFSGTGPGVFEGSGVVLGDSWRHCLGCEIKHLGAGRSLVIALASVPGTGGVPGSSREQVDEMALAINKLLDRLPSRTAVGRLTSDTLAAYSLTADAPAAERALLSLLTSLEGERRPACLGILSVTGVAPTDSGAALLDIAQWLLDAATSRGPATALHARLAPAPLDGGGPADARAA